MDRKSGEFAIGLVTHRLPVDGPTDEFKNMLPADLSFREPSRLPTYVRSYESLYLFFSLSLVALR